MSVTVYCDKCGGVIDPARPVLRKDEILKVRIYSPGGTHQSLRLDLCRGCSLKMLEWLNIASFEELTERIDNR